MEKKNVIKNKRTGLLEAKEFDYELQNVSEPQLYRGMFDYEHVPKIVFNARLVPMHTPERIFITDTTFRDGQQSTAPLSVEQIRRLYTLMSKLGGKKGLIRQTEFFLYSDKDKEAVRVCREAGLEFPEITSWIRADEKDFKLVKEREIRETGILVSCSDYHIYKQMGLDRKQALESISA